MANQTFNFPTLNWTLYAGSSKTLIAQYTPPTPTTGFTNILNFVPNGLFAGAGAAAVTGVITADGLVIDNMQGSNWGYVTLNGQNPYFGSYTQVFGSYARTHVKLPASANLVNIQVVNHGVQNASTIFTFYKGDYPGAYELTGYYQSIEGGLLFQQTLAPAQNVRFSISNALTTVGSPFTIIPAGSTGVAGQNFYIEELDISISGWTAPVASGSDWTLVLNYGATQIWAGIPSLQAPAINAFAVGFPNEWLLPMKAFFNPGSALTLAIASSNANNSSGSWVINGSYQVITNYPQ